MTRIAAVSALLPEYCYTQREITELFAEVCLGPKGKHDVLRRLHSSASVTTRHLALPLQRYGELTGFTEANDAFIDAAVELGARAVQDALDQAGLHPRDVDLIMSTTVTGVAVPSLEARVAGVVGLRPDVKRVPLFGLGCLAGAAGLARMHDFLRGSPDSVGVLLSVELCSLTLQRDDPSVANMVASGLFGDGAAAAVVVGAQRSEPGPEIVDSRSHLYPDSQRAMGWDIGSSGLKVVLGVEVPDLVSMHLADDVKGFLADHELEMDDISTWVAHPGGPKVLQAVQTSLDIPPDALEMTWRSLAAIGNLSSASVLHVLKDTLRDCPPAGGAYGLLFAMGPGFCAELVLLRW
ncbi:MAG: type III polyketide synthase [Nocardioidaceae bacterium]